MPHSLRSQTFEHELGHNNMIIVITKEWTAVRLKKSFSTQTALHPQPTLLKGGRELNKTAYYQVNMVVRVQTGGLTGGNCTPKASKVLLELLSSGSLHELPLVPGAYIQQDFQTPEKKPKRLSIYKASFAHKLFFCHKNRCGNLGLYVQPISRNFGGLEALVTKKGSTPLSMHHGLEDLE